MSKDLMFVAERVIYIPAIEEFDVQRKYIEGMPVAPADIDKILKSDNPIEEYFKYFEEIAKDVVIKKYDPKDWLQEAEPIGEEIINIEKEHIKEMKEVFKYYIKKGYEIKVIKV